MNSKDLEKRESDDRLTRSGNAVIAIPLLESLENIEVEDACKEVIRSSRLADACKYLLSTKGKQLRSNIVFEAAHNGPRNNNDLVRRAAAAVELFHLATLAHDDVVDESVLRRGEETVATRFCNLTAIQSGGWLLSQSIELISDCGDMAITLYSDTAARACEGQMFEVEDLYNIEQSPERYFKTIESKTASLFELSARLGAEVSGADNNVVSQLEQYGHELGIAFQISDDLLDLVSVDELTDKLPGRDLQQGKYTLPVLYALHENTGLQEMLLAHSKDSQLDQILDVIQSTSGVERAIEDCRRHAEAAKQALEGLPKPDNLRNIVDYVLSTLDAEM